MCLIVPSFSKLSSFECQSCQLGKHTCHTFCQRVNKSVVSPFALVHYDIWGLSRVKSTLGYYCFVTFIDDFFTMYLAIFNEKLFKDLSYIPRILCRN